jgi:hypothetical protein
MKTKGNMATLVIVILVIAVAILSFTVAQSGESKITSLGGTSTSTPTIVAPQSAQDGNKLAWECPTCPV